MTPKQARFVEEYLKDMNATQAAIRSGYSADSAAQQGERLLRNADVAAEVAKAIGARSDRVQVDQDWVLSRLVQVAERCMQAEPVTDREGEPTGEYRFEAAGANRALELVGKHLGMFTEKLDVKLQSDIAARLEGLRARRR